MQSVLFGSLLAGLMTHAGLWGSILSSLMLLPFAFGAAITATTIRRTADVFVFDLVKAADADVSTGNLPHGMGVIPDVSITPLLQANAALSLFAVTTIDVTNVVITGSATMGSGNAGAQLRVYVRRPM